MNMLGGEQQSTPTDPNERDKHLSIPEVAPELIPYLTAEFDEGYEAVVQENPEWSIEHYIDEEYVEEWEETKEREEQIKKLEIISIYSFKQKINYQAVAEKEHKDLRAIRVIKREHNSTKFLVIDMLTNIDGKWVKLSSDQNPNDLQP